MFPFSLGRVTDRGLCNVALLDAKRNEVNGDNRTVRFSAVTSFRWHLDRRGWRGACLPMREGQMDGSWNVRDTKGSIGSVKRF